MIDKVLTAPAKGASLQDWLDYQLALHPSEIDMGLARVKQVADRLNLCHFEKGKVITVAGTNGKGTTCAMVESIVREAGKSVGVYSSPHMLKYNERVRVNGQDLADDQFVLAFEEIEQARGDVSLTFFEYATLAGLYLLKLAQVDLVLLEVGLGGRLDATNLVDADIAVITSIDLDHESYLGNTREAVGREKAGIFRKDQLAIIGEPNLPESVTSYASELGTQLCCVGKEFDYHVATDSNQWQFDGSQLTIASIALPALPLPNAATTLAIIEKAFPDITPDIIGQGLEKARLTGRLESVSTQPSIILDVAHNPHAANYLVKQLSRIKASDGVGRTFALCGMLADKDISGVLASVSSEVDEWYLSSLDADRSASADELAALMVPDSRYQTFNSLALAWQALKPQLSVNDMVIVFGSFYTVAEFKILMGQEENFV